MSMSCLAAADCAEIATGCCMTHVVDSVAEDSVWGDMDPTYAGQQDSMCVSAEW